MAGRLIAFEWEINLGPADYYLGLLAAAGGDLALAERHFAAALDLSQRVRADLFVAWTRLAWARRLLGDDRRRAEALLTETLALAERHGLSRTLEQVRQTLAELAR
jgi:hypothetical protein